MSTIVAPAPHAAEPLPHRMPHRPSPHLFTVDVEEHFQVSAFEPVIPRGDWWRLPSRVVANTDRLLELLARHHVSGTFFVLGWVGQRQPDLVRRIADAGHDIASHGWSHARVTTLSPQAFREEVRTSRRCLEDASGAPVHGYRAPSFSIVPGHEWALEVLLEEGYTYDSSLFPIHRAGYGHPRAHHRPFRVQCAAGELLELPPATVGSATFRLPAGGGGYLRQFPFGVTRWAYRAARDAGGAATLYVHPWELDPEQPRVRAPFLTRVRHYRGLSETSGRLARLLSEFAFTSVTRWWNALDGETRAALPRRRLA